MARQYATEVDYEEVTVLDMPALFTPLRIFKDSVPKGCYLYEMRHDGYCQGEPVQIGLRIMVNYWGSLVTRNEIKLGDDGLLDINPDDVNFGAGDCRNISDFIVRYPTDSELKAKDLEEVRAIENKYGLALFGMSLTHLVDVGIRHLDEESVNSALAQIEQDGRDAAENGATQVMSPSFQRGIIRCAAELASFPIWTLFRYIKENMVIQ